MTYRWLAAAGASRNTAFVLAAVSMVAESHRYKHFSGTALACGSMALQQHMEMRTQMRTGMGWEGMCHAPAHAHLHCAFWVAPAFLQQLCMPLARLPPHCTCLPTARCAAHRSARLQPTLTSPLPFFSCLPRLPHCLYLYQQHSNSCAAGKPTIAQPPRLFRQRRCSLMTLLTPSPV